jgi:predicted ester cyclase
MSNLIDSVSENKKLITDYLDALSNKPKNADTVGKYVTDEVLAKHIAESEAAFPNYELIAEEMAAEGDLVVVRGEFRGVHRGPFAGIEPTGKAVSAGLIIIYKVENGKIVNHWMQFDTFSLLQQLQSPQPNVALVQSQLLAFGRSDINALVDNCASDCEIHSPGPEIIPYSGVMKGHGKIRGYFEKLIGTQSNTSLSISQIVAQGNTVVVMGSYSAHVKATGKIINTPVTLTFEMRDDKIARYMALGDTAAVAAGYTQTSAAAS